MNRRHTSSRLLAGLLLATGVSGAAHATLDGRDLDGNAATFEAYYDTDLDITWLADANYAMTSGYDMDGQMTWSQATTWAANLAIVDAVNNITYDNWRLPTTLQPDASCNSQSGGSSYGYTCAGSEMGHLFHSELGGAAGESILSSPDPDLAKFSNIQNREYWSESEYVLYPGQAWIFFMDAGWQAWSNMDNESYAWAVTTGDVAAVPEAQTYALMLAGLGLVGWRVRRRG